MTPATQDADLRERLLQLFTSTVTDTDELVNRTIRIVFELSRAGGERTQAGPGAVTTENFDREDEKFVHIQGDVKSAVVADIRENVARETANLQAEIEAEVVNAREARMRLDSLRDENERLRSHLAAVESELGPLRILRSDALLALDGQMGSDADDSSIVEACIEWKESIRQMPQGMCNPEQDTLQEAVAKLFSERDELRAKLEAVEAARAKAMDSAQTPELDEIDHWQVREYITPVCFFQSAQSAAKKDVAAVIAAKAAELSTLRAALAKAEEEVRELEPNLRELAEASDGLIMDNDLSNASGVARFAVALTAANRALADLDRKRGA